MAIIEALILYKNVQIPIGSINKSLRKMKEGEFSTRMQVTDIRMPGVDGLSLIENLKQMCHNTKYIVMSGHAEFGYVQRALSLQVEEYLLKPISPQDMIAAIVKVESTIKKERENVEFINHTKALISENYSMLRSNLLRELLDGREYSQELFNKKAKAILGNIDHGEMVTLLAVRIEDEFRAEFKDDFDLISFAIYNVAKDIYERHFKILFCRESHDYLIFAMFPIEKKNAEQSMERLTLQLQYNIETYFGGNISVVLSDWGEFPTDIASLYQQVVFSMFRYVGNNKSFFYVPKETATPKIQPTYGHFYQSPSLSSLFEAGRWEEAKIKIDQIMSELELDCENSELLMEAYFYLCSAFSCIAHANGIKIAGEIVKSFAESTNCFLSFMQLREWAYGCFGYIKKIVQDNFTNTRSTIIKKVQDYVLAELSQDISVGRLAEYIHFHPVYLSKLFKKEMGISLGEYICSVKINKAANLLLESDLKIYEIAQQVGYESTYFMRVFKKAFKITPHEYRLNK